MPELSIVIPAYEEAANLAEILPRLQDTLSRYAIDFEILVIDTMTAMDDTATVCATNTARYINRTGSNTYGSAVRTGFARAEGRYILFMDGDGSHPPDFIPEMLSYRKAFEVVVASRYVEGGHLENSWILRLMSQVLNWTYALVLGIPCKDISNSLKLYDRQILQGIVLISDNFDIIEELFYKIMRRNPRVRIKELPFTFKQRVHGHTKRNLAAFIITYLGTLVKLRLMPIDPPDQGEKR